MTASAWLQYSSAQRADTTCTHGPWRGVVGYNVHPWRVARRSRAVGVDGAGALEPQADNPKDGFVVVRAAAACACRMLAQRIRRQCEGRIAAPSSRLCRAANHRFSP